MKKTIRFALLLPLVWVAACADHGPLTPTVQPDAPLLAKGGDNGRATFPCNLNTINPGGEKRYRSWHATMTFRPGDLAQDGATRPYFVRAFGADPANPLFVLRCVIPNTDKALKRMHRLVGAPEDAGSATGDAQLMSEPYPLEPINVCPWGGLYPNCYPAPKGVTCPATDPNCSGSGTPPPLPGEEPDDGFEGGSPGGEDDEPDPDPPCATGDQIIDSPTVQTAMAQAWDASNVTAPTDQRREVIGAIFRTPYNGYRVVFGEPTFVTNCEVKADLPPVPPEWEMAGFFHTHPFTANETVVGCKKKPGVYVPGPSARDRATAQAVAQQAGRPIPAYIIDNEQIVSFTGGDATKDATYGRCGY